MSSRRIWILDGEGGAQLGSDQELQSLGAEGRAAWIHLDLNDEDSIGWLRASSGLTDATCDALVAEKARPRTTELEGGLVVVLRGVNLNPGADPEDMVSLRLWIDGARVISVSSRRPLAVGDLESELTSGAGPKTSVGVLCSLSTHLTERVEDTLERLEEAVDRLEDQALTEPPDELLGALAEIRRQVIGLRRHLAPAREAMARLWKSRVDFMDEEGRSTLQLLAEQVLRYVDELEELRDRSAVSHDILSSRQADALNRRMLFLAVVTAIFLPLGLIAGLLGTNLAGIPWATSELAFPVVCGGLIGLGLLEVWLLKRLRWW